MSFCLQEILAVSNSIEMNEDDEDVMNSINSADSCYSICLHLMIKYLMLY